MAGFLHRETGHRGFLSRKQLYSCQQAKQAQQAKTQKAEPLAQQGVAFCTIFATLSPIYGNISLIQRSMLQNREECHAHIARLPSLVLMFVCLFVCLSHHIP